MSVIPTKPGDRMAASAWESRKADQGTGAGNEFAALFGAAWTQQASQMQQTRAAQDQRMLSDNGSPAIAETSRRTEDGASREPFANARMPSPSREPERSADAQNTEPSEPDNQNAADNPAARNDINARKRDADNAGSDAALAKRQARQQRPASQAGQNTQSSTQSAAQLAAQAAAKAAALASGQDINATAAMAEDSAQAASGMTKAKGKRGAGGDSASGLQTAEAGGVSGTNLAADADVNPGKNAGTDALQTQRAVTAATAGSAAESATLALAGTAADTSATTTPASDDVLSASKRSGNIGAQAQSGLTALQTPGSGAADAGNAASLAASQAIPADQVGKQGRTETGFADALNSASEKPASLQGAASANRSAADVAAPLADAASRMARGAAQATTGSGNVVSTPAANNAAANSDASRQRSAAADAVMPQGKALDPRDTPAAAPQTTSARATNDAAASAATAVTTDRSAMQNPAATATASAASGDAGANRKSEDAKPASGARNRAASGIGAPGLSLTGSSMAAGVAGDTRAAIEQMAAGNAANNLQANVAQSTAALQGVAGSNASNPQGLPSAEQRVSDAAAGLSDNALNNNGSLLSPAALDGLNAFQRVAAQDEAPRLSMSTPITDPGFADELYDTVKLVSTRGLQSVEINIAPAELGPIKLRVEMTGNEAEVRFEAAQEATRNLLADAVPALKEQLAQSGIDLRHASIDRNNAWNGNTQGNNPQMGQNMGQGAGQSNNSGGQQSGQSGQSGNGRLDATAAGNRGETSAPVQRLRNALLDTYA